MLRLPIVPVPWQDHTSVNCSLCVGCSGKCPRDSLHGAHFRLHVGAYFPQVVHRLRPRATTMLLKWLRWCDSPRVCLAHGYQHQLDRSWWGRYPLKAAPPAIIQVQHCFMTLASDLYVPYHPMHPSKPRLPKLNGLLILGSCAYTCLSRGDDLHVQDGASPTRVCHVSGTGALSSSRCT